MSAWQILNMYNLEFREAHHALEDAFVTARLWQKLLAKLGLMKIANLGDLLRIARV
jgi:DNA polymerase III epsilon subunit-like protein